VLVLALLLSVGAVTWLVTTPGDDEPYRAQPPPPPSASVDAVGADDALQALAGAIAAGDRTAAAGLAAPGDTAAAGLLEALVGNARAADLEEVSFRYVDDLGPIGADGTWWAAVDTSWRFRGFDRTAARSEVAVRFRDTDDGVAVADVGGPQLRTPVWLDGPVQVRRTATTLVLAAAGVPVARYARLAERAVPVVRQVLPAWRPRLVVEVPASATALDRALESEPGDYAAIAAVTVSGDGSSVPGSPVHVFVNPEVYGRLRGVGAQVVMSHEAAHVASDGPSSQAPVWLVEGFADYVALRDVDLPLAVTARQAAAEVARGRLPRALPTRVEFDTRRTHLGAVYEMAWLACRVLAERSGEAALVGLYDDLSAGEPLEDSLAALFGWTERELVAAWRTRLSDLPGASRAS
jgi:hypothetical protein